MAFVFRTVYSTLNELPKYYCCWSGIRTIPSRIQGQKVQDLGSGSASREFGVFNPKIFYKVLGNMIWDVYPGSGFFPFRILNPGVKKTLDPGSGSAIIYVSYSVIKITLYNFGSYKLFYNINHVQLWWFWLIYLSVFLGKFILPTKKCFISVHIQR